MKSNHHPKWLHKAMKASGGGIGSDQTAARREWADDRDAHLTGIRGIGQSRFPNYKPGPRESWHVEDRRSGAPPSPSPPFEPPPNLLENLRQNYRRSVGPTDEQMLPGPKDRD